MSSFRERAARSAAQTRGQDACATVASASESGHDFICNEQCSVTVSHSGNLCQPAAGLRNHAGCALHERLEHECGVGITFLFLRG